MRASGACLHEFLFRESLQPSGENVKSFRVLTLSSSRVFSIELRVNPRERSSVVSVDETKNELLKSKIE